MNIFVSDESPIISARNLDDKRIRHMPKECIEMLTMAAYKNGIGIIGPFIIWGQNFRHPTDLFNHPCTNWVARSKVNTYWLYRHLIALFDEYRYRAGVRHWLEDYFYSNIRHYIKPVKEEPKSFQNSSGFYGTNTIINYRDSLFNKWYITDEIKPCTWTNRGEPQWSLNRKTEQLDLFNTVKLELGYNFIEEDLPF